MADMEWLDEIERFSFPQDGAPVLAPNKADTRKLIAAVRLAEKRTEQLRPLLVGPEGLLFISSGEAHQAVRKLAQDCVLDILSRLRSGNVK